MSGKCFEVDTEKLNKIPVKHRLVVFGYLRIEALSLTAQINLFKHIPSLIQYICLSYYYIEPFGDVSQQVTISGPWNNIISKTADNPRSWDNSSFGSQWIPSNSNNTIKWTFKCLKDSFSNRCPHNFFIGIVNNKHSLNTNVYPHSVNSYCQSNGGTRRVGGCYKDNVSHLSFTTNDTMTLILDLKHAQLGMDKNNGQLTDCVYDKLPKGENIKYKLVIQLYNSDISLECMDINES